MLDTSKPTVLVATDFTPASRPAFDRGVQMAREQGARLLLVHAIRPLGAPGLEPSRPPARLVDNETAEPVPSVGVAGSDWVDLARAQGVEAEVVVRPGLAKVVILEEADRVDARTIVVGHSGKEGLAKALLGSVSESVQEGTQRDVIVVEGEGLPGIESPAASPRLRRGTRPVRDGKAEGADVEGPSQDIASTEPSHP